MQESEFNTLQCILDRINAVLKLDTKKLQQEWNKTYKLKQTQFMCLKSNENQHELIEADDNIKQLQQLKLDESLIGQEINDQIML